MKNIMIKGFEHYLIDKNGNVYNPKCGTGIRTKGPKQLKSWPNKNTGYYTVVLRNGTNKPKGVYVHRLVAETYLPNPLNLPEVNHKDFDKSNNTLENLEWVTRSQNKFHSIINNKQNYTNKVKRIISDKSLVRYGLDVWNKTEDKDKVSKIWNCSDSTVYKILNLHNIDRNRWGLPNSIRLKIIEDIKNHNSTKFGKDFINNLILKYKVKITHHQFYKMKQDAIGFKFIKSY